MTFRRNFYCMAIKTFLMIWTKFSRIDFTFDPRNWSVWLRPLETSAMCPVPTTKSFYVCSFFLCMFCFTLGIGSFMQQGGAALVAFLKFHPNRDPSSNVRLNLACVQTLLIPFQTGSPPIESAHQRPTPCCQFMRNIEPLLIGWHISLFSWASVFVRVWM